MPPIGSPVSRYTLGGGQILCLLAGEGRGRGRCEYGCWRVVGVRRCWSSDRTLGWFRLASAGQWVIVGKTSPRHLWETLFLRSMRISELAFCFKAAGSFTVWLVQQWLLAKVRRVSQVNGRDILHFLAIGGRGSLAFLLRGTTHAAPVPFLARPAAAWKG